MDLHDYLIKTLAVIIQSLNEYPNVKYKIGNYGVKQLMFSFCLLGAIIAAYLKSRAFCIGFSISLWLFLFKYYPAGKKKVFIWGLTTVLLLTALAVKLKWDSSLGRVFIYKISLTILKDHFISGVGFGSFKKIYPIYQAKYFASGHYSIKELLLADNNLYVFNDYLQFIIEGGIVGAFIVISYLLIITRFIKHAFSTLAKDRIIFNCALIVCITISVAAFFTHICEQIWYRLPLILSIIIMLYYAYQAILKKYFLIYLFTATVILLLFSKETITKLIIKRDTYIAYSESIEMSRSGFKSDALNTFKSIYPDLKSDTEYLNYYGEQLLYCGYPKEASVILKQAVDQIPNSYTYVELAQCYYQIGEFLKAEFAYQMSINMVPNRFKSRYDLYVFYKQTGQTKKAYATGIDILSLPIKISSPIINYIKATVKRDLGQQLKHSGTVLSVF